MSRNARRTIAIILVLIASYIVYQLGVGEPRLFFVSSLSHIRLSPEAALTLLPGELPGYSGWLRPPTSLVGYFSIVHVGETASLGSNWTLRVKCYNPEGRFGGSFFYVRAYGRSILPGVVTDHKDGTYDITILPFDSGFYQLEVVLTFSKPPSLDDMPLVQEVAYEGYLLPGFPMQVFIPSNSNSSHGTAEPPKRLCEMSDLIETSPRSAIERGRWLVTKKMKELQYNSSAAYQSSSLYGYQMGVNSIGFQADYYPINCSLISRSQVENPKTLFQAIESTHMPPKPFHVLFIGDSNMRIQRFQFDTYFGGSLRTELIDTSGGILLTLPSVKTRLQELEQVNATYFVIFNSGLHDIDKLCVKARRGSREEYIHVPDHDFSCLEQYNKSLEEFADLVTAFPTALTVWQTTSAGWPKWGVYGAAWRCNMTQVVPLSTHVAERLNYIAWDIMVRKGVPVMDAYWLSLSRPDNREVDEVNQLSRHLVHPGLEVLSVLTRKWATMILEVLQDE